MKISYNKEQIRRPLSCHNCNSWSIRLIDLRNKNPSIAIHQWTLAYYCDECNASVTTRNLTSIPLGFMARRPVRALRQRAHVVFDCYWKRKKMQRFQAYHWLCTVLEIPENECHIAMFDEGLCQKVIELCEMK